MMSLAHTLRPPARLVERSVQRAWQPCFRHSLHKQRTVEQSSGGYLNVRAGASADAVRSSFVRHQIPYGGIIVLSGLVLGIRGPLAAGVLLGLVGMGVLLCARASLKAWKRGAPGTAYTVMSTMATAYLTWVFGLKFKMMVVKVDVWGPLLFTPPFALFLLSAAITLFQIYNVWAGGNPPKAPKTSK